MADDTKNATLRGGGKLGTKQVETARSVILRDSTVEVAAAASANSVYTFIRIPTSARISGLSAYAHDDLASTGSPTLDFGFAAVDSNITSDPDALNDGIDVATAAGSGKLIKNIANYGKTVWEILGLSADPGGFVDLIGTLVDAAANTGGTVTVTVAYTTG